MCVVRGWRTSEPQTNHGMGNYPFDMTEGGCPDKE